MSTLNPVRLRELDTSDAALRAMLEILRDQMGKTYIIVYTLNEPRESGLLRNFVPTPSA